MAELENPLHAQWPGQLEQGDRADDDRAHLCAEIRIQRTNFFGQQQCDPGDGQQAEPQRNGLPYAETAARAEQRDGQALAREPDDYQGHGRTHARGQGACIDADAHEDEEHDHQEATCRSEMPGPEMRPAVQPIDEDSGNQWREQRRERECSHEPNREQQQAEQDRGGLLLAQVGQATYQQESARNQQTHCQGADEQVERMQHRCGPIVAKHAVHASDDQLEHDNRVHDVQRRVDEQALGDLATGLQFRCDAHHNGRGRADRDGGQRRR